jgi:hypothetical protein
MQKGDDGDDAYIVWVKHQPPGADTSYDAWIDSLRGQDGAPCGCHNLSLETEETLVEGLFCVNCSVAGFAGFFDDEGNAFDAADVVVGDRLRLHNSTDDTWATIFVETTDACNICGYLFLDHSGQVPDTHTKIPEYVAGSDYVTDEPSVWTDADGTEWLVVAATDVTGAPATPAAPDFRLYPFSKPASKAFLITIADYTSELSLQLISLPVSLLTAYKYGDYLTPVPLATLTRGDVVTIDSLVSGARQWKASGQFVQLSGSYAEFFIDELPRVAPGTVKRFVRPFTFDGVTTTFALPIGFTPLEVLFVNGMFQTSRESSTDGVGDYWINWTTREITFVVAPLTGDYNEAYTPPDVIEDPVTHLAISQAGYQQLVDAGAVDALGTEYFVYDYDPATANF